MTTENLIQSLRDQAEPHGNCLLSRAANEMERLTSPEEMLAQWWESAGVPTPVAPIAEGDWIIERTHEGSWGIFRASRATGTMSPIPPDLRILARRKRPEGAEDIEAVLPDVFEAYTLGEVADTVARRMADQGFKIVRTR